MDPLESVRKARAEMSGDRPLGLAPPPPDPSAGAAAPGRVDDPPEPGPEPGSVDTAPTPAPAKRRRKAADPAPDPVEEPAAEDEHDHVPGTRRWNRRTLAVTLPGGTAAALGAAREGTTAGQVVMAALRNHWPEIEASYTQTPVEEGGLFGAPERTRRRVSVPDARVVTFTVSNPEAVGIGQASELLGISMSELVTVALDRHLAGDREPAPQQATS